VILVLWDIDRTLLYTGDIDRRVYREVFADVVGRPATTLPARGTGVTMPMAVRELLAANEVPQGQLAELANRIVAELPERLNQHRQLIAREGIVLPGAVDALTAVHEARQLLPTVVTGNLRGSAEVKLSVLGLRRFVDFKIGGFASDNAYRPALVRIAQQRARTAYRRHFDRRNTVIIGDSLQDVETGLKGGAQVIGVASGTTSLQQLEDAGADHVISDLTDTAGLLRLVSQANAAGMP
jgi:phosphoglycolate phosphatase-like HAD superfamily hydrolase